MTRTTYLEPTWTGRYTSFHSFVPLQIKRNLIKTLAYRARRICSKETLEAEFNLISNTLAENGYPAKFINKNMKERVVKPILLTVSKKQVYIRLPFRGDGIANTLSGRLRTAIERTYTTAELRVFLLL